MLLDYNSTRDLFFLKVSRVEADPRVLMREYGLTFSQPASTPDVACLFTAEPYVAAAFVHCATSGAREALQWITERVAASWATDSGRHISVPDGRALWPFQRASVAYSLDRQHSLIGDQPGLGKTMSAIAISNEMQCEHNVVVCPASIRYQWAEKILDWDTGHLTLRDIAIIISSKRGVPTPLKKWTIISWDLVRSPGIWRALAKESFDLLVLDEAHYAKHGDAKRTRSIFGGGDNPVADPLISRAKKVVALTGTPLPKRPLEAYVLARHLCWDSIDFMSEDAFADHYNSVETGFNAQSGSFYRSEWVGNEAELQARLRANFMVRHLKRDVMADLQYPAFDLIHVEETGAVKAALAAERLLDIDPSTLAGRDAVALGHIASARQQMGAAMAPQVGNYVAALLDGGEEKLVLFAWHIQVLDMLEERLSEYGVIRVDGSDGAKRKYTKVQEFINDPDKRIILGNVLSLGTGTDGLQHVSNHGLLAEADWIHGNNEQCADRLDRGGQRAKVQFDIFVAPGSISEKVLAVSLQDARITTKCLDRLVTDAIQFD